jgi:transcriptional regulator with XRE-family HTH domain
MADRHEAMDSPEAVGTDGALQAIGAALRSARLQQGLSLPDVAKRLFLRPEQLEALEAADVANLPEPVYVIAQAQRVGGFLGIDTDPLVAPLRAASAAARPRSAPWTQPLVTGPPPRTTTDRFRALTQRAPGTPQPRQRRPAAGPFPTGPLLKAAVLSAALATGALLLWRSAPGIRFVPSGGPQATPAPASPPSPVAAAPSAQARGAANQLTLRSAAPSWMEVRGSDGTTLFRGTFSGEKVFPLGGGLEVLAGRPDLVTAAVGGRPAAALGPIDQVRWHRFGADGDRAKPETP